MKSLTLLKNSRWMLLLVLLAFTQTARATSKAAVTDDHPSGDPNKTATFQTLIIDAMTPGITPPDIGCNDFHLHGNFLGHPDPAPSGCGHGIVVFLSDDEVAALTENVQKTVIQNGHVHQLVTATKKNSRLYQKIFKRGGTPGAKTSDVREFWIDGDGINGGNDNLDFGLAAGNRILSLGMWGSYSHTETGSSLTSIAFDSDTDHFMFGVDALFREYLLGGIALSYETQDSDTVFNSGSSETDGVTVAPYMAYFVNDNISIDGSFGYSSLETEDVTLPFGGTVTTSERDTDRWFASANLNYLYQMNAAVFNITMGYLYVREETDAYTDSAGTSFRESVTELGQFRVIGDAAYSAGPFEPFATLGYEYDVTHDDIKVAAGLAQPDNDRDGFRYGFGVRYFGDDGLSAVLDVNLMGGREDFHSRSINLMGRWDF